MSKNKPNDNFKPGGTMEKRSGSTSYNESVQHKTSAVISGDKIVGPIPKPSSNKNSK